MLGYGEEHKKWLKSLKVGDSFCYKGKYDNKYIIDEIVKITPKGKIRTKKELTFKSDGYKEVASTWDDSPSMQPITNEIIAYNQKQVNLNIISKFNFDTLENDKLEEIIKLIK